ncbi:hypothetical protein D3C71_1422090 [compost metagenome]
MPSSPIRVVVVSDRALAAFRRLALSTSATVFHWPAARSISPARACRRSSAPRSCSTSASMASRCSPSASIGTRCLRARSCRRPRRRSISSNCSGSASRSSWTRSSNDSASSSWMAALSSRASTSPSRLSCSATRARSWRVCCSSCRTETSSSPLRRLTATSQAPISALAWAWRRWLLPRVAIEAGSRSSRLSSLSWCSR